MQYQSAQLFGIRITFDRLMLYIDLSKLLSIAHMTVSLCYSQSRAQLVPRFELGPQRVLASVPSNLFDARFPRSGADRIPPFAVGKMPAEF